MEKKILELLSIKDENVYLKEMITDNNRNDITIELERLIKTYENSKMPIFINFLKILSNYSTYINNSFIISNNGEQLKISNGPIVGLNRKVKI